ncbi:hypothetical protein OQA88_12580 [Cercophora sp. LCS_1]
MLTFNALAFALIAVPALAAPQTTPADTSLLSPALHKRGDIFTIYRRDWKHTSCGPNGTNYVSESLTWTGVKGPCTDDYKAPTVSLNEGGSMCDREFTVCGRKVTLRKNGDQNSCKKLSDVKSGKNGLGYAGIHEGGRRVGSCGIDYRGSRFGRNCVSSGAYGFESRLHCKFD